MVMATKTKAKKNTSDWRELDQDDLDAAIVKARDEDELSWGEIKEMSGGMALGKLMFRYDCATVEEKDRIKFRSEADLPAKIKEARENNLSWGLIAARAGLPPSKIRKLYEDEYGEGSSRLDGGMERVKGRRGVVREEIERPAAKPKASKSKPAAKKAASKKSSAAAKEDTGSGAKPLAEMDLDELSERLDGRTITVHSDTTGKNSRVKVKSVKATDGEEMEFISANGGTRTIRIENIVKASR